MAVLPFSLDEKVSAEIRALLEMPQRTLREHFKGVVMDAHHERALGRHAGRTLQEFIFWTEQAGLGDEDFNLLIDPETGKPGGQLNILRLIYDFVL